MASGTGNKLTLRLLIDKKNKVVLFAEAEKEVVDFIFHLLALPIGTAVELISKDAMVGALGNLYDSVETLHATYLQCSNKDVLLKPKIPTYYRDYVTLIAGKACPSCHSSMSGLLTLVGAPSAAAAGTVAPSASAGGYVKGVVTYMVMDNLVVKPISTISSITLLNKCNVKDLTVLEEKTVDFGFAEGVKLLKASMESTNVLTNVFLGGKC